MTPEEILAFCFPAGLDETLDGHMAFWAWLMRGGADDEIISRYSGLVEQAGQSALAHWADTPSGRLALILVIDQFPRSVYRGTPKAYALDDQGLALAESGFDRGDFEKIKTPWERTMFAMPLVHAEGPTLRARAQRNVDIARETRDLAPHHLKPSYEFCLEQSLRHQSVIDQFGRHPHRNKTLGRPSTPEERDYLERGEFPHERQISDPNSG